MNMALLPMSKIGIALNRNGTAMCRKLGIAKPTTFNNIH